VKTYEIVWKDRDPADDVFPDGLDWDDSLVFHGTSSTREAVIDREGLKPDAAGVPAWCIRAIDECFRLLRWRGATVTGWGVIEAYTLRNDFRDGDRSPLYLSDRASQALSFAGFGNAGGEKLSVFLDAFEDLVNLVSDKEFHRAAFTDNEQWDEGLPPTELSLEQLSRVEACITAVQDAAAFARRERDGYRHAVVYAIRPPAHIRASWEDCRGMGLRVTAPIPSEWFVAKLRILPPPGRFPLQT
jgi:hypothetical protein